jgi:HK97 family phage major capsid protein
METMALSAFEASLVKNVVEAMTKLLEKAIIAGDGVGKPTGILTETPKADQALSIAELSYKALLDAEAALPMAYESGAVWCMSKKTFIGFYGVTDAQGQPIARTNYGIASKPERSLLGRPVVCCDYVPSFTPTMEEDAAFAFLFNFSDYTLNTNLEMQIWRYVDNKTRNKGTTAVTLVDGKVVDAGSLVVLKKGAAA